MNKFKILSTSFLSLILMVLLPLVGCNDDTEATVEILANDVNGLPVSNAEVHLFCSVQGCTLEAKETTSEDGRAVFKFDLPAILEVSLIKVEQTRKDTGLPPQTIIVIDSICADGFVKIEPGEVTRESFVLEGCND